jgi:acid phosphatase (class A)
MKKIFLLTAVAMMTAHNVQAQTDIPLNEEDMYFGEDELPNAINWLPAPPETNSTQFAYDLTQYMWGKGERQNEEREKANVEIRQAEAVAAQALTPEPVAKQMQEEPVGAFSDNPEDDLPF